mgnify:CR=1 FL=1
MTDKAKDILRDLEKLQTRQSYFEEGRGSYEQSNYIRYFPFDEDFEKKYLLEAAEKISAIYEEKVRQKVKELAAMYEGKTEKLGYAFSWLKKLKCAASDDEREEILKDWLQEISEKKCQSEEPVAEND